MFSLKTSQGGLRKSLKLSLKAIFLGEETMPKFLPVNGEVFSFENHESFLITPVKKSAGNPWIFYAPVLQGTPGPEEKWMFEKFLDAGIAIAGIDVGESYGNSEGQQLFSEFYNELVNNRGFSKKPVLLPRSRGGLMLYNWAAKNPELVSCIAGIYPVCDISSYPGLKIACESYNMSEEEFSKIYKKYNPVDNLKLLAEANIPIFHIHGDIDEPVPLEKNSGELSRRYKELGGDMVMVVPKGQGHNYWDGFFQCKELVDFVIKYNIK